jgi:hypothetical protein
MLPHQKMKFVNDPSAAPQGVWTPINRDQFNWFAPDLRGALVELRDGYFKVRSEGLDGSFTGVFQGNGQPRAEVQGQVRWAMVNESAFLTFSAPNGLQYFATIYRYSDWYWGVVLAPNLGGWWG